MNINGKPVSGVAMSLVLFLAAQFIVVFAWGVRVDVKVTQLEAVVVEKELPERIIKIEAAVDTIKDNQDEIKKDQKENTQRILDAIKEAGENG